AWLAAWAGVLRHGALRPFREHSAPERALLIEATAVLLFLTARSVPESTAAFFGIDLVIAAPVMAFLGAAALARAPATRPADAAAPAPPRRVLACAFACHPPASAGFTGGEDLLGWEMARQLARRDEVWLLTDAANVPAIEAALRDAPEPRLRVVPVALPRVLDPLRRVQGGIQLHAYLWQWRALATAERLHASVGFDVFQHLTYANDWMASPIGAQLTGVPFVRGPGGGAHRVPRAFLRGRGLRFRLAQRWRSAFQSLLRADPAFTRGQERASALLLCNREALDALPERWRSKAHAFPVNGIAPSELAPEGAPRPGPFTAIAVGKLLPIKGFDLALRAFAGLAPHAPEARLVLIGDGPERARLERLADDLGIAPQVAFRGWRPRAEALQGMREAHCLLFPSLRDGGGAVVVEAMAQGVPCIVLDLAGPATHVTPETGFKVPAGTPEQATRDMAEALRALHADPALRARLGEAARRRAEERYLWDRLGDRLAAVHDAVLPPRAGPRRAGAFDVLGTAVSAVRMEDALGFVARCIDEGLREHVCVCSVNMVMTARKDPELRRALDTAGLVVPDGSPLTRAGERRGLRIGRVRGTDLVHAVSARAAQEGWRCYFLGGAQGVPERVAAELQRRYPGLQVAGACSPPFRDLTPDEDEALLADIAKSGADVLWVGLGCPKQERWMLAHRGRAEVPVMLGVGAAFDFLAGTKREAPRWMRHAGLEWLWRFGQEPVRLWKRVFVEGPQFVALTRFQELREPAHAPPEPRQET
ncbi:MAG: WecB/TagA/CpsF family glycosyltransferase, partial [Halobacteriales archaeon]|nr:WecB/TagA/CpsF family glycosyltransferase [Halobacteriales archaeon]